jgi:integrase
VTTKPGKRPARAARNQAHLSVNRSGFFQIAWPRALTEQLKLSRRESLGTRDRAVAEQLLRERLVAVLTDAGDEPAAARARRQLFPVSLPVLITNFLIALRDGTFPPRPAEKTIADTYIPGLLGARSGLSAFARNVGVVASDQLTRPVVERYLDELRARGLAADTIRLRRQGVRRLVQFAVVHAHMSEATAAGVLAVPRIGGVRGRARTDGVPSLAEVTAVLDAMQPAYWRRVAEVQLRLGLRRSEVLALRDEWIDEQRGRVRVRISAEFTTKDREERSLDADAITLKLAREVAALHASHRLTATGYRMAWRRALAVVAKAGVSWPFRAKSHALRQVYATRSVAAGIPLRLVADRLGHGSVRVTEVHYLDRVGGACPATPFEGVAPMHNAPAISGAEGRANLRLVAR